jgi:hypothetical protein
MTKWTVPDSIWADFDFQEFTEYEPEGTHDVEYIRKDIYDKRIEELDSVLHQQIGHIYRLQNTINSMTAHIRVDEDE